MDRFDSINDTVLSTLDLDALLFITCLVLAAWTIFNFLKTAKILAYIREFNKVAANAREATADSQKCITDMMRTSTSVQQQYVRLIALYTSYEETATHCKYLAQIAPDAANKEDLTNSLSPEDTFLHMSVVSSGKSVVLDNRISIIYREERDGFDVYDRENKLLFQVEKKDPGNFHEWLMAYVDINTA